MLNETSIDEHSVSGLVPNKTIRNALNLTGVMLAIMSFVALATSLFVSSLSIQALTITYLVAFVVQLVLIFQVPKYQNKTSAIYMCFVFALLEGVVIAIAFTAMGVTASELFAGILVTAIITMVTGYIGYNSKDMGMFGNFLTIAMIALLVTIIANLFIQSSLLNMIVMWGGAIAFSLFIMFNVNQMRHNNHMTYPMMALGLFIGIMGLLRYVMSIITSSND